MHREHPFDRYAPFTDVAALKEWSGKPLKKSVRVNTLKCSVERFMEWAEAKGWTLEQVPWCGEGFFVERPIAPHPSPLPKGEGNTREALGKDLLHLIGGFYIQEAASMLPVVLLDPQPGDAVLDMSAAPGSKATQIGARMAYPLPLEGRGQPFEALRPSGPNGGEGCVRGTLLCNDIQEHRLWTLKSSLHRCGVTNAIVTKKVGQWFAKHMTERFDRVLCDAPCTAQGTARKDSDALNYCGAENVATMARLQVQLLEAAIHAAKVGGRIVYSTCTLTPEENESVVFSVLQRFGERIEVCDPRELSAFSFSSSPSLGAEGQLSGKAIEDSFVVQRYVRGPSPEVLIPTVRLWPQTYDTEGFFCAVLEKRASTREVERMEWVPLQEERVPAARQREIAAKLEDYYGTSFLRDGEALLRSGEQLFLAREDAAGFPLPVCDYAVGLPFAKLLTDRRIRLSHEMALLRGATAMSRRVPVDDEQFSLLLSGRDAPCDASLHGDVLLQYGGFCFGRALAKEGILKNNLPRWMVR